MIGKVRHSADEWIKYCNQSDDNTAFGAGTTRQGVTKKIRIRRRSHVEQSKGKDRLDFTLGAGNTYPHIIATLFSARMYLMPFSPTTCKSVIFKPVALYNRFYRGVPGGHQPYFINSRT